MQLAQTAVPRLVLPRGAPLVPCNYSEGLKDKWRRRIQTCGALVPHHPKHPCPECGNRLIPSHAPDPPDGARIINDSVAIIDQGTGQVVAVHVVNARRLASEIAESLRYVTWEDAGFTKETTAGRLSGLAIAHNTFGFSAPVPMRRRYGCSRSQFNVRYPKAWELIQQFALVAEDTFRIHASEVHDITARRVRDTIAAPWLIAGTPWTGGIINRTAALPYHTDKSNISSSWSAMLVCRRDVAGGLLHLADYNVYLAVPHGSITIFDGQSVVHGVTPLRITRPGGFRYSLVSYAKNEMACCASDPTQEAHRAAMAATAAEGKRLTKYRAERSDPLGDGDGTAHAASGT